MNIAPFALERFFAKYEFKARFLLSSSDCESVSIQTLLDYEPGSQQRFQEHWLGYTESDGSRELRTEIKRLYTTIDEDHLLVCTGAEEAIFLYMNAVLERGDHVIIHTPCYQSLLELPRSIGCEITEWRGDEHNHWELDLDALRGAIRPTTRAIVFNCPHNPTGYLMSPEKQKQIVEIAREHNLLVFSDEVYRHLEHNPADTLPATCDLYENAVSLGVMSKTYGLAGLRIGWIATRNVEIRAKIAGLKDYTSICNSAPSEFLAAVALRHGDQLAARNLSIIQSNLDVLDTFFARHAGLFAWERPRAGSIAFPRLNLDRPLDEFCTDVVERKGVMVLSGTCFEPGSHNFRVGFGRANLPDAVARFDDYLRECL